MTRFEWKIKKIHLPFNLDYFTHTFKILKIVIVMGFACWYINYKLQPIKYFEQQAIAKELKRQEEYIKESQSKELAAEKYIAEQIKLQEKYELEEKSRKAIAAEIEACAKKFKVGDRIKIYDLNAPLIKENDHFRWSIGGIDVITNIIDTTLYCESGERYTFNEQIDKVRSNREWRDLVNMQLKGELFFVEDNNNAP